MPIFEPIFLSPIFFYKIMQTCYFCRPINECFTPSRAVEMVRKRAKPLLNNHSELFSAITLSVVVILVTQVATRV